MFYLFIFSYLIIDCFWSCDGTSCFPPSVPLDYKIVPYDASIYTMLMLISSWSIPSFICWGNENQIQVLVQLHCFGFISIYHWPIYTVYSIYHSWIDKMVPKANFVNLIFHMKIQWSWPRHYFVLCADEKYLISGKDNNFIMLSVFPFS